MIDHAKQQRERVERQRRNRARGLPLNHGAPWRERDDKKLMLFVRLCKDYSMSADAAIAFIAPRFARTRCSIYCRLFHFGLVEGPFKE